MTKRYHLNKYIFLFIYNYQYMDKLIQKKKFFYKTVFELTETGLHVQQRKQLNSVEYFVDYEDIGVRILKSKTGINGWLIAAIASLVLAFGTARIRESGAHVEYAAELFYLAISAICGVIYWLTYKETFYLVQRGNSSAVEFVYDNPTKEELEEFIQSLKSKRKKVLDEKYGQINLLLPYEQNHQNLMWLFNNDVVTKSEFDERLLELDTKFNRPIERKIGFKRDEQ